VNLKHNFGGQENKPVNEDPWQTGNCIRKVDRVGLVMVDYVFTGFQMSFPSEVVPGEAG
jgi:hypothetical protein